MDYYQTLGVAKSASADEIRKAYRKLAKQNHPDARPDDPQAASKFKEIQEAYDVLGDATKRTQYDRLGPNFHAAGGGGAAGPGAGFQWSSNGVDLGSLFGQGGVDLGDLFGLGAGPGGRAAGGRRGRGAPPQPGADAEVEASIPFLTAVEGGEHELHLQRNGQTERLVVKIPPGVEDGNTIRLAGQGQPSPFGGPPGALLVKIRVAPHAWFRREGADLLVDVPLSITEAALGAKVEVPTMTEGIVMVTVPPGTSSHSKLRLRGKGGIDRATKKRGDLFAVIKIVVPQSLTPDQRTALATLADLTPPPRENLWQ